MLYVGDFGEIGGGTALLLLRLVRGLATDGGGPLDDACGGGPPV